MRISRALACFLILGVLLSLVSCEGNGEYARPSDGEMLVAFIDVGQGDCAVIRTQDTVIVVDTGCARSDGAELLSYLRRAGVQRIDLLVISHPHEDHVGGVPALLREYDVGECLMPDLIEDSVAFRAAVSALTEEGCGATRAYAGVSYEYGGLLLEVLSPTQEFYSDINDAGAVIRVSYGEISILFTGDVSADVEKELVRLHGEALDADILKVAHHGSVSSTCEAFLSAVAPQYAAISCEAGNEYGFPDMDVLARLAAIGAEVHRTDTEGTIVFSIKDSVLSIKK